MQIIQTRFKDVPLDELGVPLRFPHEWESNRRGRPIQLIANAEFRKKSPHFSHDCVFYYIVGGKTADGLDEMACAHVAEIGD